MTNIIASKNCQSCHEEKRKDPRYIKYRKMINTELFDNVELKTEL